MQDYLIYGYVNSGHDSFGDGGTKVLVQEVVPLPKETSAALTKMRSTLRRALNDGILRKELCWGSENEQASSSSGLFTELHVSRRDAKRYPALLAGLAKIKEDLFVDPSAKRKVYKHADTDSSMQKPQPQEKRPRVRGTLADPRGTTFEKDSLRGRFANP